jgi:hypothetical protein
MPSKPNQVGESLGCNVLPTNVSPAALDQVVTSGCHGERFNALAICWLNQFCFEVRPMQINAAGAPLAPVISAIAGCNEPATKLAILGPISEKS